MQMQCKINNNSVNVRDVKFPINIDQGSKVFEIYANSLSFIKSVLCVHGCLFTDI